MNHDVEHIILNARFNQPLDHINYDAHWRHALICAEAIEAIARQLTTITAAERMKRRHHIQALRLKRAKGR